MTSLYAPDHFSIDEGEAWQALCDYPFAMLVTGGDGLKVSHIPVLPRETTLAFHLARANPQCNDLAAGAETLLVFQGPHSYISPTWYDSYPAVPSWNYLAVHAAGPVHEVGGDDLAGHVTALTDHFDQTGWQFDDQPDQYRQTMQRGIRGFQMTIESLTGKAKMNQNRTDDERAGAIRGLEATGDPDDAKVAQLIAKYSKN